MSQIIRPECLRCQTPMEIGYLIDRGDSGSFETLWAHGEPAKGWLGDLITRNKEFLPVRTFCCPRCGYLESYVPRAAEQAG